MTELDEELGPEAAELIDEFGATFTLTRVTEGEFNPATLSRANVETATDYKALALEGKYKRRAQELSSGASLALLMAGWQVTEPEVNDTVTFGSLTLAVLDVEPIYSGQLACLYVLYCGQSDG